MTDFLFDLIVKPPEMLFEFIFTNSYYITENIVLSIFILSFAVSVLCLPLYLRADELQEEESEIQKKLSKKVNSIKKNFKGDERDFLLQTYYRQNNYHPIMGLRLSLSLLLQVPIFMAAYAYFGNLDLLNGLHFGIIKNLGAPDGLLKISGVKINILPIFMTCISLLASFIYTKSKNIKGVGALVTINLIFLALLYNSPSALVLYWLFNNLFSLIKNICLLKISREKLIKYSLIFGLILYYILHKIFIVPLDFMVFVLLGIIICNSTKIKNLNLNFDYKKLFILSLLALWIVLGFLIPSNAIATSPIEFYFNDSSPLNILFSNATFFAGAIIFWGFWVYYFANTRFKKALSVGICLVLACAIVNLYLTKIPLTALTNTLNFAVPNMDFLLYSKTEIALYILTIGILCSLILIEILKKQRAEIINKIVALVLISATMISIYNIGKITSATITLKKEENKTEKRKQEKYIKLSSSHKNVLIIFVDRAVGAFLPIIFKEHPELAKQYQGFTFYPNTLSYAGFTLLSYPAILGGYEYAPIEIDKSEKVFEKEYIEAISVLPRIFADNNWKTTVINPMGGQWNKSLNDGVREGDLKTLGKVNLYKKSNIELLEIPDHIIYSIETERKIEFPDSTLTKHNFIYFSLLSTAPITARSFIYDEGNYHSIDSKRSKNNAIKDKFFLKNYAELFLLDKFTTFSETNNTFTILNNALPHHPADLSYPNYDLSEKTQASYQPPVSNREWLIRHYGVNVATIKLIGKYLDFLKANNTYDNTKIIIVADHGYIGTELPKPLNNAFQARNITPYNPLLLVKDFEAQEEFKQSEEFMTNADVPTYATNNTIQNPKNPYTNKAINNEAKKAGIVIVKGYRWKPEFYIGKKHIFNNKDRFNFIKGNPTNHNNWKIDLNYEEVQKYIELDAK